MLKDFIKRRYINGNHPIMLDIWFRLKTRKMLAWQEKASRMTYAEIEAEVSRKYERVFGRPLNWDNPQTCNEKINVSKVYMPTPLKTRLADKLAVREWITEKIGGDYLIPLLGVYDSFDDIDFASLPDRFVIKCSHDSGSTTLVRDKGNIDVKYLKKLYVFHLLKNWAWQGFEMHYKDIKPRIIIEPYLGDTINEYKFYCFDGKPQYCFVTFGRRYIDLSISFYDMNWVLQEFTRPDHTEHIGTASRPPKYDEMKEIAAELCKGFDHVRVDLYGVNGNIYNGEMTFATACGAGKFSPDEWDYKLGELWPFDNTIRKKVLASHTRP